MNKEQKQSKLCDWFAKLGQVISL